MKRKIIAVMAFLLVFLAGNSSVYAQSHRSVMYDRGYRADVQVGTIWYDSVIGTVSTSHGYSFGNGLYVGGGIGLYINPVDKGGYSTRYQIPVFAEIRYSFLDRTVSPFVDLKAGGFYDYTLGGAGYSVRPSIGVDIWRFSISAGWDHNRYRWDGARFGDPGWYIGLSYTF